MFEQAELRDIPMGPNGPPNAKETAQIASEIALLENRAFLVIWPGHFGQNRPLPRGVCKVCYFSWAFFCEGCHRELPRNIYYGIILALLTYLPRTKITYTAIVGREDIPGFAWLSAKNNSSNTEKRRKKKFSR